MASRRIVISVLVALISIVAIDAYEHADHIVSDKKHFNNSETSIQLPQNPISMLILPKFCISGHQWSLLPGITLTIVFAYRRHPCCDETNRQRPI